jgi:phosphate transport system substrate-binding protein
MTFGDIERWNLRSAQVKPARSAGSTILCLAAALLDISAHAAEIRVTGSDLLGEGFSRVVAEFARQEDVAVKLDLRGTRPGIEDLNAGRADVGIFLLPAAEPPPAGHVTSRVVGYQVAVVAVPAASPLTQVTVPQLRGIFAEAGGKDRTLFAVAPQAGLGWPLFQQVILQGTMPQASLEFLPDGPAFAERLRAAENGIGITGAAAAGTGGLRMLAMAAGPTEPAYLPTPENVHRGSYPLRLTLYVTFRRSAASELQRFLKFLLADETAAALAPADFVPLPVNVRNQLVFELEEMR